MREIDLGQMLPGSDVKYSLDFAKRIPPGAALSAVTVTMREGGAFAAASFVSFSGSIGNFSVEAIAKGAAVFDVVGTFSDGSADGAQFVVLVI